MLLYWCIWFNADGFSFGGANQRQNGLFFGSWESSFVSATINFRAHRNCRNYNPWVSSIFLPLLGYFAFRPWMWKARSWVRTPSSPTWPLCTVATTSCATAPMAAWWATRSWTPSSPSRWGSLVWPRSARATAAWHWSAGTVSSRIAMKPTACAAWTSGVPGWKKSECRGGDRSILDD